MTRSEFCTKWEITEMLSYYYARKYKEVWNGRVVNYDKLSKILETRLKLREYAQELLVDKKPKDLYSFFNYGSETNMRSRSWLWLQTLFMTLETPNVREREYQVILKVINKFGGNNG